MCDPVRSHGTTLTLPNKTPGALANLYLLLQALKLFSCLFPHQSLRPSLTGGATQSVDPVDLIEVFMRGVSLLKYALFNRLCLVTTAYHHLSHAACTCTRGSSYLGMGTILHAPLSPILRLSRCPPVLVVHSSPARQPPPVTLF